MKINLTTLSPLLTASGESSAHIDVDVKYDKYGLPYIPGKTIKGLLRESTIEVCEIKGFDEGKIEEVISYLYGKAGEKKGGVLQFNSLRLPEYDTVIKELARLPKDISPKFIQNYFTTIKKQTTLTEDGVAKDRSLRTYRLIRKNRNFEGEIENSESDYKSILENSILNLRYIGIRRNRGFGKVKIQAIASTPEVTKRTSSANTLQGLCKLRYILETKNPLQISKQIGDQNTVDTEDYVPAQRIRGLMAELLIKKYACASAAHKNENFKKYILDGEVNFSNAFPFVNESEYHPTPLAFEFEKIKKKEDKKIFNKLSLQDFKNTKSEKGWYRATGSIIEKKEVFTTSNFHSTRMNDRVAGRSTKDDGAIFYYESIEEGQSFKGEIIGSAEHLNNLKQLLEANNGEHRIGKSKTAQYALVEFSDIVIEPITPTAKKSKGESFYLVFQSPVIVYNEYGMAIPDVKNLQKELDSHSIQILKIASGNTLVENYMGVWRSKTNRENCFAMGTTLLVKAIDDVDIHELQVSGIGERTNEGYGCVKVSDLLNEYEYSKKNNEIPENSNSLIESKNNIIKEILAAYTKDENDNKIKTDAINKSSNYKLNNHQVYRLREKLKTCSNITEWQEFLRTIKDKKAGEAISKSHLWDEMYGLTGSIGSFEDQRLYWITFFNALRVKSKKEKNHE